MKPIVHWLGGWASSLECWEPLLRERLPDFDHRFLDTHALLDKTPADAGLNGLPKGHAVAGWSMGTLLAHHWMARGIWPVNLPLLSICPVFQFLRSDGYGTPIILRMEKKIETDRETVLRDFWRRMPKASEIPPVWEESWIAGTRKYSNEELNEGLEFLRNIIVDPGALDSIPIRWSLLAGDRDTLAPVPDASRFPPHAKIEIYPGGHVPFWEFSGRVETVLKHLSE